MLELKKGFEKTTFIVFLGGGASYTLKSTVIVFFLKQRRDFTAPHSFSVRYKRDFISPCLNLPAAHCCQISLSVPCTYFILVHLKNQCNQNIVALLLMPKEQTYMSYGSVCYVKVKIMGIDNIIAEHQARTLFLAIVPSESSAFKSCEVQLINSKGRSLEQRMDRTQMTGLTLPIFN